MFPTEMLSDGERTGLAEFEAGESASSAERSSERRCLCSDQYGLPSPEILCDGGDECEL